MESKTLIIVESPTKAKTIKKILGSDCTIIASKGHIRKIPENEMSIDFEHGYKPVYVIDESKKDVISEMKKELKNADQLVLATDEDREGESISWHLKEVLKPKVPCRRMVFHEITKKAVLQAFNNGREIDMKLVEAQEARRVLDRLFGYTLSPVLWSKLGIRTLSSGRVQSPGLHLIVEREKKRINYKKSEYYGIKASFSIPDNSQNSPVFFAKLDSYKGKKIATGKDFKPDTGEFSGSDKVLLLDQDKAQAIIKEIENKKFQVTQTEEKIFCQHPAPPFMTSTLQQEGNRKLHMSARETMSTAQSLYEKGFITYMRTDSLILSEEGIKAARDAVVSTYSASYLNETVRRYSSKSANAQEAHEAIRPAGDSFISPADSQLSGKELALYTLIYQRTLACQMKDAQKCSTVVTVETEDAVFTANGVRTLFTGFTEVYTEGKDSQDENEENVLPPIKKDSVVDLKKLEEVRHETKEPSRFTEASLVQELEKLGIGRPSTYATIIERLLKQKYVIKEGSALVPTFIGFGVIQVLEHFPEYIEYKFTSDMENDLDAISNGQINKETYLKNFYEGTNGLESKVNTEKKAIISSEVKTIKIPQLSEQNTVKLGKYGPYVQDKDGKYYSVPASLTPYNITDEKIAELEKAKNTPKQSLGTTKDGFPVYSCSGRFGDYWQMDCSKTGEKNKNFKIPKDLLGQTVPIEIIEGFFALPRLVGKNENGEDIICTTGKFGPYVHCADKNASLKSSLDLLSLTKQDALQLLSESKNKTPKKTKK